MTLQLALRESARDSPGAQGERSEWVCNSWRVVMVSGTSRRFAVPMVVACAGVFGAAEAAHAAGGLSVTPAILEHRAALGTVGSLTLNNTTNETLKVTVNVRPWRQELNGKVLTDPRATFNRYVRATRRSFTIARRRQGAGHLPDGPADRFRLALRQRRHPRQADPHQGPQGHHPPVPADQLAAPAPALEDDQAAHGRGPGPQPHVHPAGAQHRQHDRPGLAAPTGSAARARAAGRSRASASSRASSSRSA